MNTTKSIQENYQDSPIPTAEPVVEIVLETVVEPVEAVVETVVEAVVETVVEPVVEPVEALVETVVETVVEPLQLVEKTISEPISNLETSAENPILFISRPALMSQFLLDILVKNDNIKEFADKITLKVSNKTLEILKKILAKAPEALDKVVENVNDILSDGVIDHKDIPKMIILITNLYKTDLKGLIKSRGMTTTDVVYFIQFILKLVVDLKFVVVYNKVQIFEIIDASAALLEMILPTEEIKCNKFFPCFRV
jgi:hypothetical protein